MNIPATDIDNMWTKHNHVTVLHSAQRTHHWRHVLVYVAVVRDDLCEAGVIVPGFVGDTVQTDPMCVQSFTSVHVSVV